MYEFLTRLKVPAAENTLVIESASVKVSSGFRLHICNWKSRPVDPLGIITLTLKIFAYVGRKTLNSVVMLMYNSKFL